ncbi:MAG: DUF362 domain-containing protein [Lentisphaeria bacterium]|nr:DUF362 domain-containing protein [Lentisphaeria bacterium]
MERRDFLKGAAALALTAGIAGKLGGAEAPEKDGRRSGGVPDLVALRGESPAEMFDAGIALLGGMKAFVKPGQSVVIKPNIGWDRPPESGANANPELVGRMVKRCLEAGAKDVFVFDHTCDNWVNSYSKSGIKSAVEAEGGKMVSGAVEEDYREVEVPGALRMKNAKVHRLILDCDVFFNVPVLKHHGGAKLTCAMKNFMGIVWDRRYMHGNDLQQCIADASLIRRPDLNVVDAFRVMTTGGPRGNANSVVRDMKSLLLSRDIVAVDTAAARMIGFPLETVAHIPNGEKLGLGSTKLETLDIRRVRL